MAVKKARGLSFEEKRQRMLEFFHDRKEFFQLRELEKFLPKEKGIVAQTVKEVLQSLVDDHLVMSDKIGTSNYFWSFPGTALINKKTELERVTKECERLTNANQELNERLERARRERSDTDERRQKLARYYELKEKVAHVKTEIEKYKDLDPQVFEQNKRQMKEAKAAADRWTDNIFLVQSYCVNNFGISRTDFLQQFGIPEDFDYVPDIPKF